MAGVPYANIRDQIESILKGDARTGVARIYIEEEPQFGLSDAAQAIAVFTDRRSAPADQQPLAAGRRTRFFLDLLFVVLYFSHESYRDAANQRDTLLANLELVLQENRTLNNTVSALWLEGGEIYSARDPSGSGTFVAVAEVTVRAEVTAIS